MLVHTQEVMITLQDLEETLQEHLKRDELDPVQWYLLHRMLGKIARKIEEVHCIVSAQRPGEPVVQVLRETDAAVKTS